MGDIAKTLIVLGGVLIVVGVATMVFSKIPGVGRLPGDIFIKGKNFIFYFPLATCILLSIVLSFLLHLWNRK